MRAEPCPQKTRFEVKRVTDELSLSRLRPNANKGEGA